MGVYVDERLSCEITCSDTCLCIICVTRGLHQRTKGSILLGPVAPCGTEEWLSLPTGPENSSLLVHTASWCSMLENNTKTWLYWLFCGVFCVISVTGGSLIFLDFLVYAGRHDMHDYTHKRRKCLKQNSLQNATWAFFVNAPESNLRVKP